MSWTLQIYDPTGATLISTVTNETAIQLDGGFRIGYAPTGEALKLECSARNDMLGLPPRGVVTWALDGTVRFRGVVPDPPSLTDPDLGSVLALGGREALRVTLMDGKAYRSMGVFAIVRDILARLCPPCLTYDPTLIGDGSGTDAGPTLDVYYAPTADLVTVLEALAKSAGVVWAPDRLGRVLFGHPSTPLVIPYQGSWRRLPVQGRETCTRATLRIVSAPSLPDSSTAVYTYGLPATVTTVATHAEHPTYHAEGAFEVPEGVGLVRPSVPASTPPSSHYDGAPVMDEDASTYVTVDLTNTQRFLVVRSGPARVVGVEFDYAIPATQDSPADPYAWALSYISAGVNGEARGVLPVSNTIRTVRVILPPGADTTASTWTGEFFIGAVLAVSPTPSTKLFIYRARFLVVDELAAQRVAESYLQVPFSTPAEIVLDGVYDPTDTVTITGTPEGDVTGPVASWELRHLPDGTRQTRIQLGATDESRAARAIKWAVRK